MRRQKYISLGEAIDNWLSANSLRRKIDEAAVINNWAYFVGNQIAQQTQSLQIKENVLTIKVQSGVIRHELLMYKATIVQNINKKYGYELVKDIRFN